MKLNLHTLLQVYEVLKLLHYQTPKGFHHTIYDDAMEDLGELTDTFIETYLGIYGRDWKVGISAGLVLPPNNMKACVDRYKEVVLDTVVPHLYEVAGARRPLRKLAEDYEQAAEKYYGLLKNFEQ